MRLIVGSLDRAGTLVASFKQVAVDQSSERRRRIDLHEFVDEVLTALHPIYRRGPWTVVNEVPDGVVLDTYPGALFRILTNLVNNSVLHAFPKDRPGRMEIRAIDEGDRVTLVYRDDGVGMSADVAARAFDPFFTTRRGSGGSGLGLHLAYNLATQLLGGTIELRTSPGAGVEFAFRLPLSAPQRTEAAAAPV
jgi:signal transduction histidine kinase